MKKLAQCGCGDLQVTVIAEPQMTYACHCDYCQRATGSIASFAAVYREQDVITSQGVATEFSDFPKWPGAKKHFCPRCGTTVHWVNPSAFEGMRMVAIGCFSDTQFSAPDVQVQTQYRHDWCPDFAGAAVSKAFT
jgi:hypothetical protein